MIRRYMPKYNILLRDDKSMTYLRINFKDKYPSVSFTRRRLMMVQRYLRSMLKRASTEKGFKIPTSSISLFYAYSVAKTAYLRYHRVMPRTRNR